MDKCTVPCGNICGQCEDFNIMPEWEFVVAQRKSDGFILAESAMNGPGATPGIPVTVMDGSGHMQMKNDSNMELAVDAIFTGDIHPFFYTEER